MTGHSGGGVLDDLYGLGTQHAAVEEDEQVVARHSGDRDRQTPRSIPHFLSGLLLYLVSMAMPTREHLWVFGADGGTRFAGNPKYAFLHAANNHDDVRAVWVSDDPEVVETIRAEGYEAYETTSSDGIRLTLLAEYVFVSHGPGDVAWWATGGTDVVQLWHGSPIKSLAEHPRRDQSLLGRIFFTLVGSQWDRVVTPSQFVEDRFITTYDQNESDVVPLGYPRNDVFRGSVSDSTLGMPSERLSEVRQLARDHPVAIYMPTWRPRDSDRESETQPANAVDFQSLEASLAAADAYLLVKLHPRERLDVDLSGLDHVIELSATCDPYPLLPHIDVLATDYSSVAIDFLLTDSPIVFYPYDRESFGADPGFTFDYDVITPGPTPTTFQGFERALVAALRGTDEYATERESVRHAFIDYPVGSASERLYQHLTGSATA